MTTQLKEPETKSERQRCAHNALDYLDHMGPIPGVPRPIPDGPPQHVLVHCPFYAMDGARYCWPHTVLHNAPSPQPPAELLRWISNEVRHIRLGYIFQGPGPGTTIQPVSWWARYNCNGKAQAN